MDNNNVNKNINMFQVKENDVFAVNMSAQELHQVWQNIKNNK